MNQSLESEFAPEIASEIASGSGAAPQPAREAGPEIAARAPVTAPGAGPDAGAGPAADAPAALADLVAAGLVSHEMIGDPARLAGEVATLRVLSAHVPGTIWRIEPYHYAFRLADRAAGSATSPGMAPEMVAAALAARLAAELGADAAWVSATDLLAGDEPGTDAAGAGEGGAVDLDAPLLLLRAGAEAVADGVACAGAGVQAVVSAGFAARAARIAAHGIAGETGAGRLDPGAVARLAALEAGQARIEAALAAEAESRAATATAAVRLTQLLAKVLRRLDAQADVLHGHVAREDQVAGRLGEIAALAGAAGARESAAAAGFQETLGLTLAEFLARLERRAATGDGALQGPLRAPQVS